MDKVDKEEAAAFKAEAEEAKKRREEEAARAAEQEAAYRSILKLHQENIK